jgi:integrase
MKLLALTFVRTSELIEAKWAEIDFDAAEWRIPAERMKMKRLHIVPLAPQAIQVLLTLQVISRGSDLLFPGERDRKKPLSRRSRPWSRLEKTRRLPSDATLDEHALLGRARRARIAVVAARTFDWRKHLE